MSRTTRVSRQPPQHCSSPLVTDDYTRPAFTISVDELRAIVRDEVATVHVREREAPRLLDRRGLAVALGCCVDTVDRLRREGCPEVVIGDAPRFELDRVLSWLRAREGSS
jgi:hypothetical protein